MSNPWTVELMREEFEYWFPVPEGLEWGPKIGDYTYTDFRYLQKNVEYSKQWQSFKIGCVAGRNRAQHGADGSAGQWIPCSERLPPEGVPVRGYNPKWIDNDFNPKGVRECFRYGDGKQWNNAKWLDSADCYATDDEAPTHWQDQPQPPQTREGKE